MHAKLKKVDLLLCAFINNSRIKVFYCEIEEQGKTAMPPMFKKCKTVKERCAPRYLMAFVALVSFLLAFILNIRS